MSFFITCLRKIRLFVRSLAEVFDKDTVYIRTLGFQAYEDTWSRMKDYTLARTNESVDELWFLEHPPVFTQGLAGKAEHLLAPGDIPVIQTDRGGQVTYHGPGQLVVYFLIDIERRGIGPKSLVRKIEESVIALLQYYNIKGHLQDGAPGVFVNNEKIASIGLRIKNKASYHGLSLNIDMDLEPFSRINPCGFQKLKMTQMKDFVPDISVGEVSEQILKHIKETFMYNSANLISLSETDSNE